MPITRSLLPSRPSARANTQLHRVSDPLVVRVITVASDAMLGTNEMDEAVQKACLIAKAAEQAKLEKAEEMDSEG